MWYVSGQTDLAHQNMAMSTHFGGTGDAHAERRNGVFTNFNVWCELPESGYRV
jgi:hypothetical protein